MRDYNRDDFERMLVGKVTETVFWETGKSVSVEFRTDERIGGPVEGVLIRDAGSAVCPVFRMKEIEKLLETESMETVVSSIARDAVIALKDGVQYEEYSFYTEKNFILNNVVLCLTRKEDNEEVLSRTVNRDFLDMTIYYRVVLSHDEDGMQSYVIPKALVEENGITEDELYKRALENTKRVMPSKVSILSGNGFYTSINDIDSVEDIPEEQCLVVLSNVRKLNGASAILDAELMRQIADRYQRNLVIYPSSIHECIVQPVMDGMSLDELNSMVVSVNETQVSAEEQLSDHVYLYVRETGKIIIPDNEILKTMVC